MRKTHMLYRDWLTVSTQLIWCYDHAVLGTQDAPVTWRMPDAGYTRAWLVRSGWIEIEQNSNRVRARPGQWLLLDNTPHSRSIAQDTHILSVAFESTWPDGNSLFTQGFPFVVEAAAYPRLEQKLKIVARTMRTPPGAYDIRDQPMDYRSTLQLQRDFSAWLLVLLDVLVDHNIAPNRHFSLDMRVMQAIRLLDAHPLGKPLAQKAIAEAVGLSPVHLTRLFASDLHVTPRTYFEKRRIEHARRHLSLSDVQIKEVAYSLGFHDLSHFSKWFKQRHHMPPRQYARTVATSRL